MYKLPKHFCCPLREDFGNVDYSKWERKNPTNGSKLIKLKPVHRSALHHDHDRARASHGPTTVSDSTTNKSTNHLKHSQSEISENSLRKTAKDSSAAFSGRSKTVKTDKRAQDLPQINDSTTTLQVLMKPQRRSISDLEKHCEVLQETNQQVARDIEDTDRRAVLIGREFLIHHRKLGSSITTFNKWRDWQIRQAKEELKEAVYEGENQLQGLQAQLQAVEAKLVKALSELHTLKTYKDKEFPVKALQIAEMKRDLDKLKKAQKDEYEDVMLLCQTEMTRLERHLHQKQQEVLLATAKKNISHVPPRVREMTLHNHMMKKEIDMHKKEIMQLEDQNRKLLKSIQELRLSRPNTLFSGPFPSR